MESRISACAGRGAELRLLAMVASLALLSGLLVPGMRAATGDPVLLNEALVSHTGTDNTEYVELFGTPGAPLGGLSLVSVEGDSAATPGTIDRRVDFAAGAHLGGNGFYLVGNPVGLAANYHVSPDVAWGDSSLENGSQTLALVRTAGLGDVGTVVTGSETVRDAVGLSDAGPTDQWFWNAPVVGPDDGFLPGGARRLVVGVDTDTAEDWAFADDLLGPSNTPTPATPYDAPPVVGCGAGVAVDEGTPADAGLTATDPDGLITSFSARAAPDPGTFSVTAVIASAAAGDPASATLHVSAATPPGSYAVTITALNDEVPPQTASCDLTVTVNGLPDPTPEPTPVPPAGPSTSALWSLANQLAAQGVAPGKALLVTERLERIDRFMASGQDAAAAAQAQALANQVMGLSPRWISDAAARSLAAEADALRAALAS
jgi:hypothetical protein